MRGPIPGGEKEETTLIISLNKLSITLNDHVKKEGGGYSKYREKRYHRYLDKRHRPSKSTTGKFGDSRSLKSGALGKVEWGRGLFKIEPGIDFDVWLQIKFPRKFRPEL